MSTTALLLAAVVGALGPSTPALRVLPRPEIPWLVAVAAPRAPALAEHERRALVDAGGHVATVTVSGVVVVSAEGPPEAEALVLAAVHALAPGAAVFLEGRTTATSTGALPAPRPAPPLAVRGDAHDATAFALPLPWQPWLLDDDGEVVRALVARELARRGGFEVALRIDGAGARLELAGGPGTGGLEVVRQALREVADEPAPPRLLEALRAEAEAARARRGAVVGDAARRAALRAWWFGAAPPIPAGDLGLRVRAAILPEALRAAPGAQAAQPAP